MSEGDGLGRGWVGIGKMVGNGALYAVKDWMSLPFLYECAQNTTDRHTDRQTDTH